MISESRTFRKKRLKQIFIYLFIIIFFISFFFIFHVLHNMANGVNTL